MQLLTATAETQGWRDNDFCWTVEGELVFFPPIECGRGSVDDRCGCRRSMAGLASQRATTTVKVTERKDLSRESYLMLITDGLMSQGYVTDRLLASPEVKEWVDDLAAELMFLATPWPIGTVLERRGDVIVRRTVSHETTAHGG